jgi:Big-like domain-containing protein
VQQTLRTGRWAQLMSWAVLALTPVALVVVGVPTNTPSSPVAYVGIRPAPTSSAPSSVTGIVHRRLAPAALESSSSSTAPLASTTSLTSSVDPSAYGQAVTFTASVSPAGGRGTVGFFIDGLAIDGCTATTLPETGQASCTTTATGYPGDRTVSADYSGDSTYLASRGTLTQTVIGVATDLSATPAVIGLSPFGLYLFNLTATLRNAVTGAPVGPGEPVIFSSLGTVFGVGLTNIDGVATLSVTENLGDVVTVAEMLGYSAVFSGNATYKPASASASVLAPLP